jgi:maltooligosyltrehalose trehalohydrolase
MPEFTVWAPRPQHVEVVLTDRRLPMSPTTDGWWSVVEESVSAGTDYAFSLDGGPPRADPRSAWQPAGVTGPSRLVDHGSFAWTDAAWRARPLAGSVLYECHVGTFSAAGTFDGAIEQLGYLADLGIDAVEIMPVAAFPGARGWGYDQVSLFAPQHGYGGPAGFQRLVDAAHRHGLAVILDVIYNHLGPSGNYLPEFGPYFTDEYKTAWGPAINFDGADSTQVRRFVIDNALMWLRDYHCDGLRLDATHAIYDASATHILAELTAEVRALAAHERRPLFVIAESDRNDPRLVIDPAAGGYGLDASWADDWHHALHTELTGERTGYYADFGGLATLAKASRQAWVLDGGYSGFRRRVHGRSPAGLSGGQFVVSTQNHDQVGNRAAGERSGALMSTGRLKIAAALLLTSPFVPMLFQGEEWGASTPFPYFTDHADPALAQAVRAGRRAEFAAFGWPPESVTDPQDPASFERASLDWSEQAKEGHADLLAWHRDLIKLRARIPALTDPRLDRVVTDFDESAGWLTVRRGPVLVAVNLGPAGWSCPVPLDAQLLASSDPAIKPGPGRIQLPPDSVAIISADPDGEAPA